MLDDRFRRLLDRPLDAAGRTLARVGVGADQMSIAGFAAGMSAAIAVAAGLFPLGFCLIVLNRVADGLDGAIARATSKTDRGGFLDISLDFVFYAAIPLAFAVQDPARNALPSAILLASFLANGAAFFAYAIIAARPGRMDTPEAHSRRSIYYVAGLAEGAETIVAFVAFCLWPQSFPWLAIAFAALCCASACGRIILGWRDFR